MSYLVDMPYFVWSLMDPDNIDDTTLTILSSAEHTKYVSVVTFWEISLKYSIGKLELKSATPESLVEEAASAGYETLKLG